MKMTLITGASGGIGEEFARQLAARSENVLLVARSADKLAALCDELKGKHKVDAQFVALDLTERDATQKLFDETMRRGIEVETLVNNAGFGSMGDFTKFDIERDRSMIELNITALVALTHLYLPLMRARRGGAIINVASTAAFQAVPYMATYAATKAFVLSFSEALWEENRAYGVKVLALCPGTTDTNFFDVAHGKQPPPSITQTPAEVVETALRALARNKSHVVSGWANSVTIAAERLVPRSLLTRIAGRVVRSRHQLDGEDSRPK